MSYSFNVKASTKQAAKDAVAAEFDKLVVYQPVHAGDQAGVLANANTVIDLLADDDTKDISVACNGSVNWVASGGDDPASLTSVSVSCSASYVTRQ